MAKGTKTIEVEIPELDSLPIQTDQAERLDNLCVSLRSIQDQIAPLEQDKRKIMEQIKPLAEELGLPERTLGTGWDLRRTVRVSERVNTDRLKMTLLQNGWNMHQIDWLLGQCTDHTETSSWAVYGRKGTGTADSDTD